MTTQEAAPLAGTDEAKALRRAVRDVAFAVDGLDQEIADEELRRAIFMRLLDERLGNGHEGVIADEDEFGDSVKRTSEIAGLLEIPDERVGDLFDLRGPIPVLKVEPARLAKPRSEAVGQIILLVTAARTALDLPTGMNDVRAATQHYGKFDDRFDVSLERCDGIALHGQPSSRNRRIRLLHQGLEDAKRLAQTLLN